MKQDHLITDLKQQGTNPEGFKEENGKEVNTHLLKECIYETQHIY